MIHRLTGPVYPAGGQVTKYRLAPVAVAVSLFELLSVPFTPFTTSCTYAGFISVTFDDDCSKLRRVAGSMSSRQSSDRISFVVTLLKSATDPC